MYLTNGLKPAAFVKSPRQSFLRTLRADPNKKFSKSYVITPKDSQYKKKIIDILKSEHNDLQETVEQRHPIIRKIIKKISMQKGCYFSRLTGSGSACIGLFFNMKTASFAKKIIKRKFPKYWCQTSKTI